MAEGTKGTPGLPQVQMAGAGNVQTNVSPTNIFDMIKQGYSQSLTAALPYAQAQFGEKSKAAEPQIAAIKASGEEKAAMAQSDAGARGMRGSDIEAAAMGGARSDALQKETEFRSQLAMQEAQFMAEQIMSSYGFDLNQNTQMYTNLAQAIGQELSQQREMEMMEKQLAMRKKELKQNQKSSLLASLISAAGTIGAGALTAGPAGAGAAALTAATKKD